MMGRRHVHASVNDDYTVGPEERKEEKPGFFSRKLANFLRRSSLGAPRADGNAVVPSSAIILASPSGWIGRRASGSGSSPKPITTIDPEIVFGIKHYAAATNNGVRAANEDRFRVISNLELFGKGLITADRKVHTYQDVLDQQLLEVFARRGSAPRMDIKKLLRHKSATATEFFGIFDGHGGAKCSTLLALLFPLYVLLSPDFQTNLIAAAKRACLTLNDEILRREAEDLSDGGSTGLAVFIRNNVAYICNIGDCRAILITRKEVRALSTDHKATNETEKQRIEDAGGLVLYVKGIARVNGRLAVTRAFGDAELQQYVIANPEITCHELTSEDEYIVLASDGLWDVLSNEAVMTCIRNHPWLSIDEIAQVLINRAIELGSMDNITVLIIDVRRR